jgi:ATP-binding cassette, subfamily B (MDR/TAP), member 1
LEDGKYEAILEKAKAEGRKKPPIYAVMFCIQFFSIYAGYGLAFWQGIRMYHSGEIANPGQIVTYVSTLAHFIPIGLLTTAE